MLYSVRVLSCDFQHILDKKQNLRCTIVIFAHLASIAAPLSSSSLATLSLPCNAAKCSGVLEASSSSFIIDMSLFRRAHTVLQTVHNISRHVLIINFYSKTKHYVERSGLGPSTRKSVVQAPVSRCRREECRRLSCVL